MALADGSGSESTVAKAYDDGCSGLEIGTWVVMTVVGCKEGRREGGRRMGLRRLGLGR